MTYELEFHPDALKEWGKLDQAVKKQFKKKLDLSKINQGPFQGKWNESSTGKQTRSIVIF